MLNIGLTGSMASGKNFVASIFEELGCYTIDADTLSRETIAPGGTAAEELFAAFGHSILKGVGVSEYIHAKAGDYKKEYADLRAALRGLVAGDEQKRRLLENIVHPAVDRLRTAKRKEIARKDSSAVIVYHAPLLIEAYLKGKNPAELTKENFKSAIGFDLIILIWASRETALERIINRGHPPIEDAVKLLAAQLDYEEKLRFADHTIDNDGDKKNTRLDTLRVFNLIKLLGKG
jgi:dephospho-CoA kinase